MNDNKKSEEESYHQDFVKFTPETVKFVSAEDMNFPPEHAKIIGELRNKSLTVKDIHELFYDTEDKKYSITIKTVYRYIEKLAKAGLVTVSGYRITEGTRVAEKLYSRTASIFFPRKGGDEEREELKNKDFVKKVFSLMGVALNNVQEDFEAFNKIFQKIAKSHRKVIIKLLEETNSSSLVKETYSDSSIEEINNLNIIVGLVTAFLKHPELFEELQTLFKK